MMTEAERSAFDDKLREELPSRMAAMKASQEYMAAYVEFQVAEQRYVQSGGELHHKRHRKAWRNGVGPYEQKMWSAQHRLHDACRELARLRLR